MIEIDWKPERRKLRDFGLLLAALLLVWAIQTVWRQGLAAAATGGWQTPLVFAAIAAASLVAALLKPDLLRGLYVGWMIVAFPISWVVSNTLLAVTYYVLFTAVACVFRVIGRDVLQRRFDPAASTYWHDRGQELPPARYFRQF